MPEPNFDYYWDDQLRDYLKDDENFCQYCERPIAKNKTYCSNSCREADYL